MQKLWLWAQNQGHDTIDHQEERGVKREIARRSSFKGRERTLFNMTDIGTVWETFEETSERRDGAYNYGLSERS